MFSSKNLEISTNYLNFKVGFFAFFAPCIVFCLYKIISDDKIVYPLLETILVILTKTPLAYFSLITIVSDETIREKIWCYSKKEKKLFYDQYRKSSSITSNT
jgi:hypothetical protein